MSSISISCAFLEFIEEKRSLNLSNETVRVYLVHIKVFISYLNDCDISLVDKKAYQHFVDFLKSSPLRNDITVASYCRSIRVFLYWSMDNGYIEHFKINLPKYQTRVKRCYLDHELTALLKKPVKHCSETEYLS